MFYPKLKGTPKTRDIRRAFGGYNHNPQVAEGEFYQMENLSSDGYPLLTARSPRGVVAVLENPQGLLAKEALCYVDGPKVFYNGMEVQGLTLSALDGTVPKTLVSMGAYVVIFPDKVYFNTENPLDHGSLENTRSLTCASGSGVSFRLCREDGSPIEGYAVGSQAPEEPKEGELWLDTSENAHLLKSYSVYQAVWTVLSGVFVKLEGKNLGLGFEAGDGVELSGCGQGAEGSEKNQVEALNGANRVTQRGDDFLVVTGLIDAPFFQEEGTVTVKRTVPEMDYIIECGNRLWGCKYGLLGTETVNEIYACALGDPKNWSRFQGLSTDSYAASRGSDGPWTGAVAYQGCPIFFKENAMEKVYPDASGAHQIVTNQCRGVQKGCGRSLQIVSGTLYYLSPEGVCAYDGSLPRLVSGALGKLSCTEAAAGALGEKYYLSVSGDKGNGLYVYDGEKGLWHREDELKARFFARRGTELFAIDSSKRLLSMTGASGLPEGPVSFSAETGPWGFAQPDNKYVSRLTLRLGLELGTTFQVEISYDGGPWEKKGELQGRGNLRSVTCSILPRRCDYFALRFSGQGPFRLYALAKILEEGSDVFWGI